MRNLCLALCALLLSFSAIAAVGPVTGSLQVCAGSLTTLGNATPGGTWSTAATNLTVNAVTGSVAGVSAGTATVTYTMVAGTDFATAVVTVNPLPAPITGTLSICTGESSALSSATPGGMWATSVVPVAVVNSTTGVVTGLSAGTAFISYFLPTACAVIAVVTVNSTPSIYAGSDISCIGASNTLSVFPPGGTWSSSDVFTATVSPAGLVTGIAAGTATLSYTSLVACGATATKVITVNPSPAPVAGIPSVCMGDSTLLSCSTIGGTWSSSNPTVATVGVSTGRARGYDAGTVTISYVVAECASTRIFTVNIATGTITGPATTCPGSTITLGGIVAGGSWSSSDLSVATVGTEGVVTGAGLGTASISYSTPYCGSTSTIVSVNAACSGTPVAGAAVAGSTSICGGGLVPLSLSGALITCGVSCQWQSSVDGISWVDMAGSITAAINVYVSSSAYYRCALTCVSGGITAYSSAIYVAATYTIASHTVLASPDVTCSASHFYISACGLSASLTVKTYFGDGSSEITAVSASTVPHADIYHTYTLPGIYTVKHVLYNGTSATDSSAFSYNFEYCRTLPISLYYDANANCTFDTGELYNWRPMSIAIDSNGIPIDTVIITGGLNRIVHGAVGTVYAFRLLPAAGYPYTFCPSTGVIYDTVHTYVNDYAVKYFAISCSSATVLDLGITASMTCGRHMASATIIVQNNGCIPSSPTVTMSFSPDYIFNYAYPAPLSVVGNTITWALPSLSYSETNISVTLDRPYPLPWLIPGDTINSTFSVGPLTGDINPANNTVIRIDTVRTSYDPNDIAVMPEGYILPCTDLAYTVRFENTGNDTAHNIYVLDTLDTGLDPATLNIVTASAAMNVSVINDGIRNIAKFDFPSIMLPDSSHHGFCDGMVRYTIKARNPLADGTTITNRVGIYFDDNPAVMTNDVTNTIGISPLEGPSALCTGANILLYDRTAGGTWNSSTAHTTVSAGTVAGISAGTSVISYTVSNSCTSKTATMPVTVNNVVVPAVSLSPAVPPAVCAGTSVSFTVAATNGGTSPAYSWLVNGISSGTGSTTYSYTPADGDIVTASLISNAVCATPDTATAHMSISVLPMAMPVVSASAAPGTVTCIGSPVTFTSAPSYGGTAPGYIWFVNGSAAGTGATYTYTPSSGDVVKCRMGSNFLCRLADSVNSDLINMTVDEPLSLAISATPGLSIAAGQSDTLVANIPGASAANTYQWRINGIDVPGATQAVFISNTFADYDSVSCIVNGAGACNLSMFGTVFITVSNTGIQAVMNGDINLFPNPNKGSFRLTASLTALIDKAVSLEITDMIGQVIYSNTVPVSGGKIDATITMSNTLANGMYLLNLHTTTGRKTLHFVVGK